MSIKTGVNIGLILFGISVGTITTHLLKRRVIKRLHADLKSEYADRDADICIAYSEKIKNIESEYEDKKSDILTTQTELIEDLKSEYVEREVGLKAQYARMELNLKSEYTKMESNLKVKESFILNAHNKSDEDLKSILDAQAKREADLKAEYEEREAAILDAHAQRDTTIFKEHAEYRAWAREEIARAKAENTNSKGILGNKKLFVKKEEVLNNDSI